MKVIVLVSYNTNLLALQDYPRSRDNNHHACSQNSATERLLRWSGGEAAVEGVRRRQMGLGTEPPQRGDFAIFFSQK